MAVDRVVVPVHRIPHIRIVRAVVAVFCCSWSHYRWILRVNYLDDLLVLVAVCLFVPEAAEVRRCSTWCQGPYRWLPSRNAGSRSRYRYAQAVLCIVRNRVRLWIWNLDASSVRVVLAPVQHRPGTLDLEASIRNYRKEFIRVRYRHQFAVLCSVKFWYTEITSAITFCQEFIIWELQVVVLVSHHHYQLGTGGGVPTCINRRPAARDGTLVAHTVKLVVRDCDSECWRGAVVNGVCRFVRSKTWIKRLAGHCNIGRSRTDGFDLVFHQYIHHTIIVVAYVINHGY